MGYWRRRRLVRHLGGLYTNSSLVQLGGYALPSSSTGAQRRRSWPPRRSIATSLYPALDACAGQPDHHPRRPMRVPSWSDIVNISDRYHTTLLGRARQPALHPPRNHALQHPGALHGDRQQLRGVYHGLRSDVVSLTPSGAATPAISTSAKAIVNASNGSTTLSVGSVINISGTNLATTATAATVPPPTGARRFLRDL